MKKALGILLTVVLMIVATSSASAANHVICHLNVLSETSAKIELVWSGGSGENIQIISWSTNQNTLVITYKVGSNVPSGWNVRTIEDDDFAFPMKVRLNEQGSDGDVFTDLSVGDPGYESIMNLYYQGVIDGYPTGDVRPNNLVQRSEFAKMVTLAAKHTLRDDLASTFPDVSDTYWGRKYIMTLANVGVLSGYPSGAFGPADQITIGQVLKVIDYTFDFYNYDVEYDHDLTYHWSNESFEALVAAGIVLPEDAFYYPYTPNVNATRQQCAILLSRAMEKVNETKD